MDEPTTIGPDDWLECEDCHCKSEDVREVICPYTLAIYNEDASVALCDKCYAERIMNI